MYLAEWHWLAHRCGQLCWARSADWRQAGICALARPIPPGTSFSDILLQACFTQSSYTVIESVQAS